MTFSAVDFKEAIANSVMIDADALTVDLADGRSITVPLAWFPRLTHSSAKERNNWLLTGKGQGISWPELDEDISITSLLAGHGSMESQQSLLKWLENRDSKNGITTQKNKST